MRRVCVTGAAGFIGGAVSRALRAQGAQVVGVDRFADARAGIVAGDTTDPNTWRHAARAADVIVHTAAVVSNAVGRDEQWRVNVLGTRKVLEVAALEGVRRVVHVSSVRAFSDRAFPDGVTEAHPVRPDGNAYVDTKIASEHAALQAHAAGEVEVVVVRPGDVYGPGSQPWVLKPLAMIRAGRFVLPAMGRGIFSPVYIDDLTDGLVLAAGHPAAAGQVITISGGAGVPTRDYFRPLCQFAERRGPVCLPTWLAVGLATANDVGYRAAGQRTEANAASARYLARTGTYSIQKARQLLSYQPRIDLHEGMARTLAWLNEQPGSHGR